MSLRKKYHWKPAQTILALVTYWFFAAAGVKLFFREELQGPTPGFINVLMLVMCILCMIRERGRWALWKRLVFVIASLVVQTILVFPSALLIGPSLIMIGRSDVADYGIALLASLPIVLVAMRRSSWFVRLEVPDPEAHGH
jgi:hypothetical protein